MLFPDPKNDCCREKNHIKMFKQIYVLCCSDDDEEAKANQAHDVELDRQRKKAKDAERGEGEKV